MLYETMRNSLFGRGKASFTSRKRHCHRAGNTVPCRETHRTATPKGLFRTPLWYVPPAGTVYFATCEHD